MSSESSNFLVSVDPSSRAAGIAVWCGHDLVAFDLVKAKQSTKVAPHDRAVRFGVTVRERVADLVNVESPRIVVEVPGGQGKAHSRGLVTLGIAVGAIAANLGEVGPVELVPVTIWSRIDGGRPVSKESRAERIAEMFPAYYQSADPGLDIADAIGLGAWSLGLFSA